MNTTFLCSIAVRSSSSNATYDTRAGEASLLYDSISYAAASTVAEDIYGRAITGREASIVAGYFVAAGASQATVLWWVFGASAFRGGAW